MEFGIEKYAMLIMKKRKRFKKNKKKTERIEQPYQKKQRKKEIFKYLRILEVDTIK